MSFSYVVLSAVLYLLTFHTHLSKTSIFEPQGEQPTYILQTHWQLCASIPSKAPSLGFLPGSFLSTLLLIWPALSNLGQPCKVIFPLHSPTTKQELPLQNPAYLQAPEACPQEQAFHVSSLGCISGHHAFPLLQQCPDRATKPKNITDSKTQHFKDLTTFMPTDSYPPSVCHK